MLKAGLQFLNSNVARHHLIVRKNYGVVGSGRICLTHALLNTTLVGHARPHSCAMQVSEYSNSNDLLV